MQMSKSQKNKKGKRKVNMTNLNSLDLGKDLGLAKVA